MKHAAPDDGSGGPASERVTVTLGPGQREFLVAVAERNKTSLAFAVRYVIAQYIEEHKSGQLRLEFPST